MYQDFGYKPMQGPDTSASDKAMKSDYDPARTASAFYNRFKSNQNGSGSSSSTNAAAQSLIDQSKEATAEQADQGPDYKDSFGNPVTGSAGAGAGAGPGSGNPAPGQGLHNPNPNPNAGRPNANRGPALGPDGKPVSSIAKKKEKARQNIVEIDGVIYHKETGVRAPNQGPNAAPGMRGMKNWSRRIMEEREKIRNGERPAGVQAANGSFYAYPGSSQENPWGDGIKPAGQAARPQAAASGQQPQQPEQDQLNHGYAPAQASAPQAVVLPGPGHENYQKPVGASTEIQSIESGPNPGQPGFYAGDHTRPMPGTMMAPTGGGGKGGHIHALNRVMDKRNWDNRTDGYTKDMQAADKAANRIYKSTGVYNFADHWR